jgi:acylpyruvate hydrolase
MRIGRIGTRDGAELVLVNEAGTHWQRTGVTTALEPLMADGRSRLAPIADPEPVEPARLLPPVTPALIVGVGLNYRAHAAEQGKVLPARPPLFLKNPRSLASPFADLPVHPASPALDYEAELGIVIGRPLFRASEPEAASAIAGWVVAQDYTLRDLARPETLAEAKGGPAMAPIGPWLTTVAAVPIEAASQLAISCRVNGETRQSSSTADMHAGPVALVAAIARHLPLGPGDLVLTGSPGGSGVGFDPPRWLAAGDIVETHIAGLGTIRQQVSTS